MNGAESLVRTAVESGVEICFANPGTTELPLVSALDTVPGMRAVLCLFEGVCSAAADGYARMKRAPAMTLLHLGPGFANGIANFHNAKRARSPVFNVIGDHASWHGVADPPLASDIASLARPVSGWLRSSRDSRDLATDTAATIAAARDGVVATLIVPQDTQLGPGAEAWVPQPEDSHSTPTSAAVEQTARELHRGGATALYLGGSALSLRGLTAAGRIANLTGCRLLCDTFPARVERGAGLPVVERLPYFPEAAIKTLAGLRAIAFAGARPPVSFFGYRGVPSQLVGSGCAIVHLAESGQAVSAALEALAEALDAKPSTSAVTSRSRPRVSNGALTPERLAAVVAGLQPEGAIVMDEGLTAGEPYFAAANDSPPHTYLALTGGAIGQGLPCATGAALACPDRPVIALQADGSGLYTLQSLWTQAREGLNVTNLIFANAGYRILALELARSGIEPGPGADALTVFDPVPDWTELARGFGVPATRVVDVEGLREEFARSIAEPGPHLIEVQISEPG